MPDSNSNSIGIGQLVGKFPIATFSSTSYRINSGSAINAGATVTDTIATTSGVATTDLEVAFRARDAIWSAIPKGLQLVSSTVTAADTISVVWKNTLATTIPAGSIPASAVWTVVVLGQFSK
jgi:hypothetical protein